MTRRRKAARRIALKALRASSRSRTFPGSWPWRENFAKAVDQDLCPRCEGEREFLPEQKARGFRGGHLQDNCRDDASKDGANGDVQNSGELTGLPFFLDGDGPGGGKELCDLREKAAVGGNL